MKTAMTLLAAFGLDAALGDPHYSWHPAVLIGKLIAALESPVRRRLPDTPRGQLAGGALLAAGADALGRALFGGEVGLLDPVPAVGQAVQQALIRQTDQIFLTNKPDSP